MNAPENLKYSESDEWVRQDGDIVTIGITDYAQHELGEVVYVELPEVGAQVSNNIAFGVVESVKAVSELLAPVAGEVVEVNDSLTDDPAVINESPFDNGWMIRVRLANRSALDSLMDAEAYEKFRGQ